VVLKALADTGADAYLLIDTDTFILMKPLGVIAERLQDPIPLIGFNGRPADPVTHVTHLTLTIQGFRQVSAQFMITGLGNRQAIIGRL
jgi:hypothetical protein